MGISCGRLGSSTHEEMAMQETTYTVTGMSCGHCAQAVRAEVSSLPGVTGVDVDLDSGRVVVASDPVVPVDAVQAAVQEAGYEVVS